MVAGSAKREKGVALPRTEFHLHEPRHSSYSVTVGKVVSVMMELFCGVMCTLYCQN